MNLLPIILAVLPAHAWAETPCWCKPDSTLLAPGEEKITMDRTIFMRGLKSLPYNVDPDCPSIDVQGLQVDTKLSGPCDQEHHRCPLPILPEGGHWLGLDCEGTVKGVRHMHNNHGIRVAIDHSPPVIRAVTTPAEGAVLSGGLVTIEGTAYDSAGREHGVGVSVVTVDLQWDTQKPGGVRHRKYTAKPGGDIKDRWKGQPFKISADLRGLGPRKITAHISATDLLGNTSSPLSKNATDFVRTFSVNVAPPKVTISSSVAPGAHPGEERITVSGTAKSRSGLKGIAIYVRENPSGRYWDGKRFNPFRPVPAAQYPLSGLSARWTHSGISANDLVASGSYTVTAKVIGALGGPTADREIIIERHDALLTALEDRRQPESVVGDAIRRLPTTPPPSERVIRDLVLLLYRNDWRITHPAVGALGEIGRPAIAPLLHQVPYGDGSHLRHVADALNEMSPEFHEDIVQGLEPQLHHPNVYQRAFAAYVAAALDPAAPHALPALLEVLQSDQPFASGLAADTLMRSDLDLRGKDAIAGLIAGLKGKDDRTRAFAARALGRSGPAAREPLMPLLHDSSTQTVTFAAIAMANISSAAAVPALRLLEAAAKSPVQPVQYAAITALGQLGSGAKGAVAVLKEARASKDYAISRAAETALDRISAARLLPPDISGLTDDQAVRKLLTVLMGVARDDEQGIWTRLDELGPRAGPPLIAALHSEDGRMRDAAVKALMSADIGGRAAVVEAIEPLAALLGRNREARYALLRFGRRAVPVLKNACHSPDKDVRRDAIDALHMIGASAKDASQELVEALLDDDDSRIVQQAIKDVVIDPAPMVRAAWSKAATAAQKSRILEALRKIDPSSATVRLLIEAANDDDPQLQSFAIEQLGEMGPAAESAIPCLIRTIGRNPDHTLGGKASSALGKIGSKAVAPLIAKLRKTTSADPGHSYGPETALAAIGPPAVPALLEVLKDGTPQAKIGAAKALRAIRPVSTGTVAALTSAAPAAPEEAILRIGFRNGKSTFQVGETIPVDLLFSATKSSAYWISTRNYDRSGRLDTEHFAVNPPGRDPLKSYFSGGSFFGGGLGGTGMLKVEPYVFPCDLNEWVAIDKPGHYTLKVVSHRVGRGKDYYSTKPVPVESNVLRFEVVKADPQWEARTIKEAVARIEASNTPRDVKNQAARVLRYLGTPAAIRACAHELGRTDDGNTQWDLMAGLFGARDREAVVSALERDMEDPDLAITADSIHALIKLQYPEPEIPKHPEKITAEEKKALTEAWEKVRAKHEAAAVAAYNRAAALVPLKRGKAKSETVKTLFYVPWNPGSDEIPAYTLVKDTDVAEAFLEWPMEEQERVLSIFGERFVNPALGTAIMKVLDGQENDLSNQRDTLLRSELLRIFYKIDPVAGRRYIIGDMIHPRGNWWGGFSQHLLPDKTLPEIDAALGARISVTSFHFEDRDAQNIGRYATGAILPQVKAAYKTIKPWPEPDFYDGLIAYFLKYDRDFGIAALDEKSKKYPAADLRLTMNTVKELKLWPRIEPIIIARLEDKNLYHAGESAKLLPEQGSENAHKALLERLRRLHAEGVGRKDITPGNYPAFGFEQSLVGALGGASNWQLSNEEVTEIEGLTLAETNRGIIARSHWKSPVELEINGKIDLFFLNHEPIHDSEALKNKISRFPKGTGFVVKHLADDLESTAVLRMLETAAGLSGYSVKVDSATAVER